MRTIIKILGRESWFKDDKRHTRTYALLDTGEEAAGYGDDFEIGDKVMVFFHHNVIKMAKKNSPSRK